MTETSIQQRPTRPRADYKDLTIAELLISEAELVEGIVDMAGARDTYREIAIGAIHESNRLYTALQRERQQRLAVVAEFQQFRRRVMTGSTGTVTVEKSERRRRGAVAVERQRRPSSPGMVAREPQRPQA